MLTGGALVMLGLAEDTEAPKLLVEILHEGGDTGTDRTEIVIIQLLTLGRLGTEEGPAGQAKILTLRVQALGQEEVFLLGTDTGDDLPGLIVAKKPQDTDSCSGHSHIGPQQRRLHIQRIAVIREEAGRDIQATITNKSTGSGVPGRIATSLKGSTQTAGGERTCVRLATDQLLTGELHDDSAVTGGSDEGIMFLSSDAGHGLEPMSKMGSTLFDRPLLHGLGDLIRLCKRQGRAIQFAGPPGLINSLRKALLHGHFIENITAKDLWHVQKIAHLDTSFPLLRINRTVEGQNIPK